MVDGLLLFYFGDPFPTHYFMGELHYGVWYPNANTNIVFGRRISIWLELAILCYNK